MTYRQRHDFTLRYGGYWLLFKEKTPSMPMARDGNGYGAVGGYRPWLGFAELQDVPL